jgi:epothilone polyketide synthase D
VPPVWRALITPPVTAVTNNDSSWASQLAALSAEKRLEAVRGLVSSEVGRVLSRRGGISTTQPLAELGLDSLMAVELRNALSRRVDRTLPATLAFDHPTVEALAHWLVTLLAPAEAPVVTKVEQAIASDEPIAIVGFGCRYPGGITDAATYWRVLSERVDAVSEMPGRWDHDALYDPDPDAPGKMTTRHGGFVADIERFDAGFFGISPREAEAMDPQQRLLLETTWERSSKAGSCPSGSPGRIRACSSG